MFLQVITRTFGKRPLALARNQDAMRQQSDPDFEHTIVVDPNPRGPVAADRNLATFEATGDYVWVLDDDDLCIRPALVEELKRITANKAPDVIMVRAYHGIWGTLPSNANWQHAPVLGNVGWSCYILRREVWNEQRKNIPVVPGADYYLLEHLWNTPGLSWYWHDVMAAYYPTQSDGASE